ncbi:MAG: 16S rRNA (uracil(1498)-N(3))-methyltransferase [Gammaproteobacteria bacterium]
MTRLFIDARLESGAAVELPAATAHHVVNVLRLGDAAEVVLFDGRGSEFAARLALRGRDGVIAEVGQSLGAERESPLEVTLVQSISRGERMDFTLQKAVELGVSRIVPVTSLRTVVRLDPRRAAKRLEHWRGVVRHAAEQSGRLRLPPVSDITRLSDHLETLAGPAYLLQPGSARPLSREPHPGAAVTLLAGPEGGFDEREVDALAQAGAVAVSLGPRILRTETAALTALAVMQARWGDLA